MSLPGDQVRGTGKGKAVNILHTWKDHLWEMGRKEDPPSPKVIELNQKSGSEVDDEGLPSDGSDPAIVTTSEAPQVLDEPLKAEPPEEELNPLSQQGISTLGVTTIS